jgi:autotransporter-associated beta strand protein
MSDENKDNELQPWIEPELEARVVAWVLGEASGFEAAELERMIAEKPELGIFKRRIETVHGLLGAVSRLELDPMRLETGRREKLLETLGSRERGAAKAVVAMPEPEMRRRIPWSMVAGLAACLFIVALLASISVPAFTGVQIRSAATKKAAEDREAGLEKVQQEVDASGNGPAVTMAPPVTRRQNLATAAPAQTEHLAALDSLKALANRSSDEEDEAPPAAAAERTAAGEAGKAFTLTGATAMSDMEDKSKDVNALAESKEVPSADMSQRVAEHDYSAGEDTFGTYGDFRHHARTMIAGNGAVTQQDAQQARKQLGDTQYEQREILAAGLPAAMHGQGRASGAEKLAEGAQAGEGGAPAAATDGSVALANANSYTGATTISGGSVATSSLDSNDAGAQDLGPRGETVPYTAPATPVAAARPVAPPQAMLEAATSTAAPIERLVREQPAPVQLGDLASQAGQYRAAPQTGAATAAAANLRQPVSQLQQAAQSDDVAQTKDFGMKAGADASGGAVAALEMQTTKAKNENVFAAGGLAFNAIGRTFKGTIAYGAPIPANAPVLGDIPAPGRAFQAAQQVSQAPITGEISASDEPYSTFSLHVSDVSFLLAKAALANGQLPDPGSVRPEEFYNAFDYGDPAPGTGEKIACRIEQAAHPMLQQRNLVRIAMKVAATGRGQGQPLRLTVLLDTSGSMEREDRAASVQRAMEVLTALLGPNDAVTLIGFARQPRLLAEEVPGAQAGKLVDIVKHTPTEGGTNMEEAIKTASELALRHYDADGQNRVVMLTDGAANLGDADPAQLSLLVDRLRQQGVSFDACGVGADGMNDDILEALTRKGGGRYYFLNKPEDADEGFARQLAGAFRPAAENVKMQVRFNPDRVGKYRLIGFEKHRLKQEDFRNDKVTAAQLAAEEAAVALYQVQVLPEGDGEIGEVFVRFRDPADGRMIEQSWTIPYDPQAPALDKASPSMELAATASLLAEKLHGGPAADAVDLDALEPVVAKLRGDYAQQARVRDLVGMFEQVRRMTGGK